MAKLYFYYAAMNAGKSTTLLQSAYNYRERGMRPALFTPRLDRRAGEGVIGSRIGLSESATGFDRGDDLFALVAADADSAPLHCVFVDEAQFLTKSQVLQLTLVCDRLRIPVLCYGLRTDFRGEPFEGSKYLLAWAEELVEIKTVCASGAKATMNARLDANGDRVFEGDQIDIGHHYVAMSRRHFELDRALGTPYRSPNDEGAKNDPKPERAGE